MTLLAIIGAFLLAAICILAALWVCGALKITVSREE